MPSAPTHYCYPCNQTFADANLFAKHQSSSPAHQRDFHCDDCPKACKSSLALAQHCEATCHSERPSCPKECKYSCRAKGHSEKPLSPPAPQHDFHCDDCPKACKSSLALAQHCRAKGHSERPSESHPGESTDWETAGDDGSIGGGLAFSLISTSLGSASQAEVGGYFTRNRPLVCHCCNNRKFKTLPSYFSHGVSLSHKIASAKCCDLRYDGSDNDESSGANVRDPSTPPSTSEETSDERKLTAAFANVTLDDNAKSSTSLGADEDKVAAFQTLCRLVQIDPAPDSITQCKKALSKVNVNIHDLVQAARDGGQPRRFTSFGALSRYTRGAKRFSKADAKEDGLLRHLLKSFSGRGGIW